MLKPFPSGNWKLPGFLALPEEPESFPASLRRAVRLMRAGAAATIVWGLYVAVYTAATANQGRATPIGSGPKTASVVFMIVVTGVFAVIWLSLARMTQEGRQNARIIASVLFFFWSVMSYLSIGTLIGRPFLIVEGVLMLLTWLIGLVAVFFLWRPESSEHFRRVNPPPASRV